MEEVLILKNENKKLKSCLEKALNLMYALEDESCYEDKRISKWINETQDKMFEEIVDYSCYAGQLIDNSKEDLLEALKKAFLAMANERADKLIEKSPEDYICGTSDCGYYHYGVGFASYGATENE